MDFTKRFKMFNELNDDQKNIIKEYAILKKSNKNETIFNDYDFVNNILVVSKGKIKINSYSSDGKEYIFDILVAEDVYGENLLFKDSPYNVNLIAITDVEYYLIPFKSVEKMLVSYPKMSLKIIEILSRRLENSIELNEILFEDDAKIKIAGYLLYRSKRINGDIIELSREEIASNINLRRETVSRKLTELKDEGLIELSGNRKIIIKDKIKLKSLV